MSSEETQASHRERALAAMLGRALGPVGSIPARRPKDEALVFTIEGEIGAGKTELTKGIASRLREKGLSVCLILEPVDRWREIGILGKFYQDPARFGYSFQTYVYATRVLEIAEAIAREPDADVYLLERSPATDHIFMELQRELVDPTEMKMYYTWCKAFDLMLPINLSKVRVLYLQPSLPSCMARLAQRNREGELADDLVSEHDGSAVGGVSPEYQARLRRAHEQFLHRTPPTGEFPHLPASPFPASSVFYIGIGLADRNFRDPGPERTEIIDSVVKMMGL